MFRRVNPNGYNFPQQLNQLGNTAPYGNPMWADEQLSEFESDEFRMYSFKELRPDTRYRSIFSYRVQPYAPAVGGPPNGGGGVSWALAGIDDGVGGRSGGGNGGANGENEDEKPKELKLEFLESLRKLTTKEDSHDHRQGEKWGRVEWELPNAEWVSDLLAGR
ncbi:hypothetical protein Nepgr_029891 [Nepenthes gracilis]|uniref:Uncharacterized protein n=1 Tax=Nepenthes gracilis TaxID=150966 RepID=A0AAD3Y3N4_NEPGR|nr:hypothetical protein Nepgr_029891 [Nepenthes gracilis]